MTQCATVLYTFFGLRLMYVGARGEEDKDEEFEEAPVFFSKKTWKETDNGSFGAMV